MDKTSGISANACPKAAEIGSFPTRELLFAKFKKQT